MKILQVQPNAGEPSETFIRAHTTELPVDWVLHGYPPRFERRPVLDRSSLRGAATLARHCLRGVRPRCGWGHLRSGLSEWAATCAYLRAIEEFQPDVVLAEYGTMGVLVREACRASETPLVVCFHGYDATRTALVQRLAAEYRKLFRDAAALVASSRFLAGRLVARGATSDRIFHVAYGIDCKRFQGGEPAAAPPVFLAVGRFVDKKAPHLTLTAFAKALRDQPEARLRMIGAGPLLAACRTLASTLGIEHAVTFLGAQPHEVVEREMRAARAFVQHSVVAPDGDCEGTPVALLEAGATGIPVLTTRHASIPDVVTHGETGLLIEERDSDAMARHMTALARDPQLAARLGRAAQARVSEAYTTDLCIARLREILIRAAQGQRARD